MAAGLERAHLQPFGDVECVAEVILRYAGIERLLAGGDFPEHPKRIRLPRGLLALLRDGERLPPERLRRLHRSVHQVRVGEVHQGRRFLTAMPRGRKLNGGAP